MNEYEREKEEVNKRESKDDMVNNEGIKMLELCSNNNLIILNGTVEGDRKGEYTFVSKLGKSVIDYVCVEGNMMQMVKKFSIEELGFSDHMILKVELGGIYEEKRDMDRVGCGNRSDSKYIRWREEKGLKFRTSIKDEVSEVLRRGIYWNLEKDRLEEAIELLYNIVRRGGSEERKGRKGKEEREKQREKRKGEREKEEE